MLHSCRRNLLKRCQNIHSPSAGDIKEFLNGEKRCRVTMFQKGNNMILKTWLELKAAKNLRLNFRRSKLLFTPNQLLLLLNMKKDPRKYSEHLSSCLYLHQRHRALKRSWWQWVSLLELSSSFFAVSFFSGRGLTTVLLCQQELSLPFTNFMVQIVWN